MKSLKMTYECINIWFNPFANMSTLERMVLRNKNKHRYLWMIGRIKFVI
jgi:hypothetical protein